MHAIDEKIHADIEEIIPRPERLRALCRRRRGRCGRLGMDDFLRHDGRLLSAGGRIELTAKSRSVLGSDVTQQAKLPEIILAM